MNKYKRMSYNDLVKELRENRVKLVKTMDERIKRKLIEFNHYIMQEIDRRTK